MWVWATRSEAVPALQAWTLFRETDQRKRTRAVGSPASDRFGGRGAALAGESSDKVRE
jgi:hypothetical protein